MGGALALSLFLSCEKDKLRTVESDPLKEVPSLRAVPDSELFLISWLEQMLGRFRMIKL